MRLMMRWQAVKQRQSIAGTKLVPMKYQQPKLTAGGSCEPSRTMLAKLWIIDNQFGRRNLPDIDRIALADKKRVILQSQAKKNLSAGGKKHRGNQKSGVEGLADLPKVPPINTRKESAKAASARRSLPSNHTWLDKYCDAESGDAARCGRRSTATPPRNQPRPYGE